MATLAATPNPATTGQDVTVTGTSYPNVQTRLEVDGTIISTFRPGSDGAFSVTFAASSVARTQVISTRQRQANKTWLAIGTPISLVVNSVTPPASPPTPSGWVQVFSDDFTSWNPSNYFVYPNTWTNNYTGRYDPTIISSDGTKLRIYLHTDSTGTPRIAAFCPLPTGRLSAKGDLTSLRYEFSIRADKMPGYKGVPLLWPQSGNWPTDGEIDFPESHFDAQPAGFMHRQDGTSGGDQDYVATPAGTSWQNWHKYALEWISGTSAEFFLDDVSLKKVTSRVPNTPMHNVMQFETQLSFTKPDPSVAGYVEIEYLKIWVPA